MYGPAQRSRDPGVAISETSNYSTYSTTTTITSALPPQIAPNHELPSPSPSPPPLHPPPPPHPSHPPDPRHPPPPRPLPRRRPQLHLHPRPTAHAHPQRPQKARPGPPHPRRHPHHRLRPRHLAAAASRLENPAHNHLHRASPPRPPPATPPHQHSAHPRIRLPARPRHGALPARPGDASRATGARGRERVSGHHAAGARERVDDTGEQGLDREGEEGAQESGAGGPAEGGGAGAGADEDAVEEEYVYAAECAREGGVLFSGCGGDGEAGGGAGGVGGGDDGSGLYCGHGPRGEGDPDCEGRGGQHQEQPHAVHLHLVRPLARHLGHVLHPRQAPAARHHQACAAVGRVGVEEQTQYSTVQHSAPAL